MKDYSSLERASSRFSPSPASPSPGAPSVAPTRAARVLGRSGGYRRSYAFAMTCLIYHATTTFCRRNYNYKNDALGKTVGQMVGAARSARQNIVEGSERGATSKEQELKQYDVAKASLAELAGDYEAFITDLNEIAWSEKSAEYAAVRALRLDPFHETDDVVHRHSAYILEMRQRYASWLENENPLVAANAQLVAIRMTMGMLRAQMDALVDEIAENGGVSEALTKARLEVRDAQRSVDRNGAKVVCPKCGAPMRKRMCKRGVNAGQPFWACSRYPECDGTRRYE